jgi:hypothetical protein
MIEKRKRPTGLTPELGRPVYGAWYAPTWSVYRKSGMTLDTSLTLKSYKLRAQVHLQLHGGLS